MSTIKIVNGRRGYHLKVNGMYISQNFNDDIKSIKNENGIPYGATEWVSIKSIRDFWRKYMLLVISSTNKPYRSVWGQLVFIADTELN